jgi:serine protease Do
VRTIVNRLMAEKDTAAREPAYLGITGQTVTEELKTYYSFPATGVYVVNVYAGSGAAKGGLRPGDLIVGFGDRVIAGMDDLSAAIAASYAGQPVTLTVYRGGVTQATLDVVMSGTGTTTRF